MSTIASKMTKKHEILDPNIVKIAIAFDDDLKNEVGLYISHAAQFLIIKITKEIIFIILEFMLIQKNH